MLGGSDAGAHLDLMCHANYPTVVLGEVVRDRGLLVVEEAVEMMTDRPARHYGLRDRGRVRRGLARRPGGVRPGRVGTRAGHGLVHDLPGGASGCIAGSPGVDHVFVAGREVVADGDVTERPAGPGAAIRARHRDGVAGRCQAVAAPSMTRVVPLTVAASSEAR